MDVAERFGRLLEVYRHPDGRKWSGAELQQATGGVVIRSYVSNLLKGRIESPGYDKLAALAGAMGFPPALWFDDDLTAGVAPAWPSYLDAELVGALGDRTVREATLGISRLSDRDRKILLGIVRQFGTH